MIFFRRIECRDKTLYFYIRILRKVHTIKLLSSQKIIRIQNCATSCLSRRLNWHTKRPGNVQFSENFHTRKGWKGRSPAPVYSRGRMPARSAFLELSLHPRASLSAIARARSARARLSWSSRGLVDPQDWYVPLVAEAWKISPDSGTRTGSRPWHTVVSSGVGNLFSHVLDVLWIQMSNFSYKTTKRVNKYTHRCIIM